MSIKNESHTGIGQFDEALRVYNPDQALLDLLPDWVFDRTADLRIETDATVKTLAKFILKKLETVEPYHSEDMSATFGFNGSHHRPAITETRYATYVGKNSANLDDETEMPISINFHRGGDVKRPLSSLAACGIVVWPVGFSVDRRTGLRERQSSPEGLFKKDIAIRVDYPHDIKSEHFAKDLPYRYAFSTGGRLNGLWAEPSVLDGTVPEKANLSPQGFLDKYSRAFVGGLGNAALVLETVDHFFGHNNPPNNSTDIVIDEHLQNLTQLADNWLAISSFKGYRQNYPLTLFADQPIGLGYDEAIDQLGERLPARQS